MATPGSASYALAPLTAADVAEVVAIERATFRFPWSAAAFLSDLNLPYAVWRVVRAVPEAAAADAGRAAPWRRRQQPDPRPLVAYAGLQMILDEGHIMNVAVHPDYRRRGLGELLLLDLYRQVRPRGVVRLTLEVRASNLAALGLYHKYGFAVEGRRPRYYGDGEDALIMWTGRLDAPEAQARWEELRRSWHKRWSVDR